MSGGTWDRARAQGHRVQEESEAAQQCPRSAEDRPPRTPPCGPVPPRTRGSGYRRRGDTGLRSLLGPHPPRSPGTGVPSEPRAVPHSRTSGSVRAAKAEARPSSGGGRFRPQAPDFPNGSVFPIRFPNNLGFARHFGEQHGPAPTRLGARTRGDPGPRGAGTPTRLPSLPAGGGWSAAPHGLTRRALACGGGTGLRHRNAPLGSDADRGPPDPALRASPRPKPPARTSAGGRQTRASGPPRTDRGRPARRRPAARTPHRTAPRRKGRGGRG